MDKKREALAAVLPLAAFASLQAQTEEKLALVQRWKNFQESSGSRAQSTLAHTGTAPLLGSRVIWVISRYCVSLPFDDWLVLNALLVHDMGEVAYAEAGQDTLYDLKSSAKDELELQAFLKLISAQPEEMQIVYLRYYLLQYLEKGIASESQFVNQVFEEVRAKYQQEYLVFDAIERLDYLLYALHEYDIKGNLRIVVHVLRRHHAKLRNFALLYQGFHEKLYTEETVAWAEFILNETHGKPEEEIPNENAWLVPSPSDPR